MLAKKYKLEVVVGKHTNIGGDFDFAVQAGKTPLVTVAHQDDIYDLDYVVTKNDNEAFILENNLIKKYQPKYNVLLKDGSNYPYILLTNEKDPRLLYTRIIKKKGSPIRTSFFV